MLALGLCLAAAPLNADAADADGLIRAAVRAHGADRLRRGRWAFGFRGDRYVMARDGGRFRYERHTAQGQVEVLDNGGFEVRRDGRPVDLDPAQEAARRNALNAVVYFASLPLPLLDPAVRAQRLPDQKVEGVPHPVVEVRFAEEGGGTDHEDVFRYWFDPETGRIARFAYSFRTGGGGVRYRVPIQTRRVRGFAFVDWENHGLDDPNVPLAALPDLHAAGNLRRISTIRSVPLDR
jgi:hypothetical protein